MGPFHSSKCWQSWQRSPVTNRQTAEWWREVLNQQAVGLYSSNDCPAQFFSKPSDLLRGWVSRGRGTERTSYWGWEDVFNIIQHKGPWQVKLPFQENQLARNSLSFIQDFFSSESARSQLALHCLFSFLFDSSQYLKTLRLERWKHVFLPLFLTQSFRDSEMHKPGLLEERYGMQGSWFCLILNIGSSLVYTVAFPVFRRWNEQTKAPFIQKPSFTHFE